jgi:hypothetical protein
LAKRSNNGGIAALVGRELGKLAARKDALARQLASVEREMASVRDSVTRALGGGSGVVRTGRKAAKSATKKVKRVMSPEARAKMAESAKRRWAAAKKAGRKTLG